MDMFDDRDTIQKAQNRLRAAYSRLRIDGILVFCEVYARTNSIAEAGKAAGWKATIEKRGKELLDDPLCMDLIDTYRESLATKYDRLAMNAGKNIGDITVSGTRTDLLAADEKRVLLAKFARLAGQTMDPKDITNAIKSLAELNKMDGDLAAIKQEVTSKIEYADHSDEQLDAEIERLHKQLTH